jgi:hypothetical protein
VLPIVLGGRRLQKMSRASQDRVADANMLATETLGAVRTVQAHAREPYERGRFGNALAIAVDTARRRIRAQAIVTAVAIVLIFGAITLVLWSGAHDVVAGRMSAGTLGRGRRIPRRPARRLRRRTRRTRRTAVRRPAATRGDRPRPAQGRPGAAAR